MIARLPWGSLADADDIAWAGTNPRYEQVMDQFFNMIEPLAAHVPYMVAPGNHDASCHAVWNTGCDDRLRNFSAYRNRWRMPWRESGTNTSQNMWYSFDYGPVHFVVISTETDYPGAPRMGVSKTPGPFGDQMGWLQWDLQAANSPSRRATHPWVVAVGHRPMYDSAKADYPLGQPATVAKVFEALFEQHGVDVYITGHVHAYERSFPISSGKKTGESYVNPFGIVHLVHGCAGNREKHSQLDDVQPYSAYRNSKDFGFSTFSANRTTISWEFRRAGDGALDDAVQIVKDRRVASHS